MSVNTLANKLQLLLMLTAFLLPHAYAKTTCPPAKISSQIIIPQTSLADDTVAEQLGWVIDATSQNRCGGYYLEDSFHYSGPAAKNKLLQISSDQTLFAQHGTSTLEGNISVTQYGQEVTGNKAYLYRDPKTGKISAIDILGHVHLREPNTLVVAQSAHMDLTTKTQALQNIVYRTAIYSKSALRPPTPSNEILQAPRKITQLSAWGVAKKFNKLSPKMFEFSESSYSTCPPNAVFWQVRAKQITLDKNSGRGHATNARLYIKNIPVFYAPFLNFPIDDRRQTGFLFPSFGSSNKFGPYLGTPFYWNLAPNYDTTITPLIMAKRGIQLNDSFRYLTPSSNGLLRVGIIPNDRAFRIFQADAQQEFGDITDTTTQANLRRLENASDTRGSFAWQNATRFNDHWSGHVDYNYVTDDDYLRDFGYNLAQVTDNQLLQEADINYENTHWNFTSRIQQYETLHPVDAQTNTQNQYSRFPQFVLNADYPNQFLGLNYFIMNEATRFDIRPTPGSDTKFAIGDRLHSQPGVRRPINLPYLYIVPRAQVWLSDYRLGDISNLMSKRQNLSIPIIDIDSQLYLDRSIKLFGFGVRQTLEPRLYYVYIPYHNQAQIPLFDTTANTLTYDQLFMYNRFSGLDRLGDANQLTVGITTRFIEEETGFERMRIGVGEIIYFANRHVTLCTVDTPDCLDYTTDYNHLRRSPLAGVLSIQLIPNWSLTGNTIWNSQLNQMDNQNIALQYRRDAVHIINLAYNFVRNGDLQPGLPVNSSGNNLKQIDFSFAWPISNNWSAVGRWTQSINQAHFQNQLYGLQYDSCCWAVRFVAGKTFTNLDIYGSPVYDNQIYLQFALRGIGNFGSGDPTQYVSSSIGSYNANFGQDF
jgi:LPS-assembly protein